MNIKVYRLTHFFFLKSIDLHILTKKITPDQSGPTSPRLARVPAHPPTDQTRRREYLSRTQPPPVSDSVDQPRVQGPARQPQELWVLRPHLFPPASHPEKNERINRAFLLQRKHTPIWLVSGRRPPLLTTHSPVIWWRRRRARRRSRSPRRRGRPRSGPRPSPRRDGVLGFARRGHGRYGLFSLGLGGPNSSVFDRRGRGCRR